MRWITVVGIKHAALPMYRCSTLQASSTVALFHRRPSRETIASPMVANVSDRSRRPLPVPARPDAARTAEHTTLTAMPPPSAKAILETLVPFETADNRRDPRTRGPGGLRIARQIRPESAWITGAAVKQQSFTPSARLVSGEAGKPAPVTA